jgi:hypothetical protein
MLTFLIYLICALCIPFFIRLATTRYFKSFPYRQKDVYLQPGRGAFEKYKKWNKISALLTLAYFIIAMLIICGPLFNHHNFNQLQDKRALFIVLPDRFSWVMTAWMPVLGLSPFLIVFLGGRLYLGYNFSGYLDYINRRNNYNAVSAITTLCVGITLLGITLFYFLWNYSLYAYRDKIVVHWFFSTKAQTYLYNEIDSIRSTPPAAKRRAAYLVTFKDDQSWDTDGGLQDPDDVAHIQFISKKSGVKIDMKDAR